MKYCTLRGGNFWSSTLSAAQQALDRRELVLAVQDLEGLRQRGIAMMGTQEAVAQAVEGADPHAAGIDRQHRGNPRQHLLGGLVGEGHREDRRRARLSGGDEPGEAGREHPGLAAARPREDQRMLRRQRHRGELLRIQVGEEVGHDCDFTQWAASPPLDSCLFV